MTRAGTKTNEAARAIQIAAEPSAEDPGLYTAAYIPRDTGGYRVVASVRDAAGKDLGKAEAGWASDPAAEEFRSLQPNTALLEAMARKSGGEMIPANRLESIVEKISARKVPIMESWSMPLWHQPAVFLLALICFVAEWGLRRWHGLA